MNRLKAEIERKRKEASPSPSAVSDSDGPSAPKYARRVDLDKAKQDARAASPTIASPGEANLVKNVTKGKEASPAPSISQATNEAVQKLLKEEAGDKYQVSNEEAVTRLRKQGQPIRLFAESDKDRRLRLRALELLEGRTRDASSAGQRNDFMKALEMMDDGNAVLDELARRGKVDSDVVRRLKAEAAGDGTGPDAASSPDASKPREDGSTIVDLDLIKTNPHKLYPQIYFAIKKTLKEWEQFMHDRPEHVKRSTQGKLAAATQVQSGEYLKPLFKLLRKRELEADVLKAIAEIVHNMQTREYLKANNAYLRLSIGNAPWPIGVTMVGIHERSAREKIHSDSVAHVLNDECSRKYIQSLKRLMTFCQTIRPPDDLSQLMG